VYDVKDHAKATYAEILGGKNPWLKSAHPQTCTECGECEKKCPQNLPIVQQLKETHATLYCDSSC